MWINNCFMTRVNFFFFNLCWFVKYSVMMSMNQAGHLPVNLGYLTVKSSGYCSSLFIFPDLPYFKNRYKGHQIMSSYP